MSKKQKRMLRRILASAVLFVICVLLPVSGWPRLLAFLVPYGPGGAALPERGVRR